MKFLLAYLFMKNNGNCGNRIHTGILIDFLVQLKECDELESEFFISDKNFVQISAIHFIWKNIKVQLYLWYIEKAVKCRPVVSMVLALIFEVAEDENLQVCKEIYKRLISTTEKVLDILKDQQDKGNFKWVKSVEKNV
uniref:Uncharacterized protein n=1 Tax=Rhizophagus irregularis (strain DAOM 181602 / DAOM 197198 / MUCL 43194) TaxID=747089 RepID=U9U4A6_RHIID